jgi:hypothetical protein
MNGPMIAGRVILKGVLDKEKALYSQAQVGP